MDFSQEQIEAIDSAAALFFTYEEIGFIAGINKDEMDDFISEASDKYTELGCRIHSMRLKSSMEIRQRQLDSATSGSANAQSAMEKYIIDLNFE